MAPGDERPVDASRDASERLALLLKALDQPIWEWTSEDRPLWFSDAFAREFGPTLPPSINGIAFWKDVVHPDDAEALVHRLADFIAGSEDTISLTYRCRRRDGAYADISDRCYAMRNADGTARRVIGVMSDVTEQRRAEQLNDQIRTAIEFASDAISIIDNSGRSLFHNQTFVKLLGYDVDELNAIGGLRSLLQDPTVVDEARQSIGENGFWAGNAMVKTKSNKTIELFLRADVVRDDQNEPRAAILSGTDVSEDRKVQRKLSEQAALLNQAQDAIVVQDLDGRITYWNKGAERLFGWAAVEVIGQRVQDFLFKDDDAFEDGMVAVLQFTTWNAEIADRTKDGRKVLVESRWTLVKDSRGKPKSILTISTDITEKKKLESQFLRAQRMESIGTLAGGIAHDLNNVLGPIIMAIDLFKTKLKDPVDFELLDSVDVSARRGADMVRQVLSFARGLEGRRMVIPPGRLIRDITKIARKTFPKSITVETNIPDRLWNVVGDPTQLHQVLLNLAVNARDAMPEGGTLSFSAANVELDEYFAIDHPDAEPGSYVVTMVRDTGTGMTSEVMEKIFEPFFTTKALGTGTGLGLSTTISIVKSHRGFITVESEPEKGAIFQVYLPAETSDPEELEEEANNEMPRGNNEFVLVIDDEASVRAITRQTLETFGYRVMIASDGAEGVSIYARHMAEISVVVTDMMMPVMDGASTIRALLRLNSKARIIAVSGIATKGGEAVAAGAGEVHTFLPKPFTAGTLLRTLRQVIDEPAAE